MRQIAIAGMPRSGSTLLCNILNQNPRFYATSTSALSGVVSAIVHQWSNSVEVKGELNDDREKTEARNHTALRGFITAWNIGHGKDVVFDKSRGWNYNSLIWFKLFPDSRIIVPVRDLRAIMASCEKQHRKDPTLDDANNAADKTILGRASRMFSDEGVIGSSMLGVEDMIRRRDKRMIFVQYESLVDNPKMVIERIYEALDEPFFDHDFDNIEDSATDPDGFYLHKFPHHNATGKLEAQSTDNYREYLSPDIIAEIMKRGKFYNKELGYV